LVYILKAGQNFLTNGGFRCEGYAAIYLAPSNKTSQAIDCMDIFILLSGGVFMVRFNRCFLYAMDSLVALKNWGEVM
jgi:hypothetical protein